MIIREAIAHDAASIARVVVDTWRTTYTGIVPQDYLDSLSYEKSTGRWQERLSDTARIWPGWFTYVAEDNNNNVIGFAGGGPSHDYGLPFSGELGFIYLLKSHQRQGTGRQLTGTVASRLTQEGYSSMVVWVFTGNPFRVFYEALGGSVVAARFVDRYGGHLAETAYGWDNLDTFVANLKPDSTG
jgi:L-amino acid N-acyltransferase YncA